MSTGAADGLNLRKVGTSGRSPGRSAAAALSAACTSRAAPSTSRVRSNCIEMLVVPCELTDVSSVTPAISPRRRSIGAAMVAAMVCGSAPGRLAWTRMVGKSIAGRLATGSSKYAVAPSMKRPAASSAVPMGRRMKGAEKFMALLGGNVGARRGVIGRRAGR